MRVTFLGTRGEIKIRSRLHWRHSALLVKHEAARIMVDCGADWLMRLKSIAPSDIVLTHAHPDHAAGLAGGAPCPVYATKETLKALQHFAVREQRTMPLRKRMTIRGISFEAFPVQHSIRAPAVGYRISANRASFFYVPDVAKLPNPSRALRGTDLFIGDGATMTRSMVREKNGMLIGHAAVSEQLVWCAKAQVHRAIFTHCGSPIVRGDARVLNRQVRQLAGALEIDARIACDGDELMFE
jgi:ribonuclease BN (tRNA processing enzyme)